MSAGIPTITLGVTVRNDRAGIARLLACIALQTRAPDELVIVDAASTDGTREACERFANDARFPVRVESAPCTRGGGRARIVALAKGDLVAFTDADCEPPPTWLAELEAAWHGEAALGGPSVSPSGATPLQRAVDYVMVEMEAASFDGVNTCNALYRRDAVLAVGNFDAALQVAEDPDLNARLRRAGQRLRRTGVAMLQRRRATWRALVRQHYEYGKGARVLLDRYPEAFPRIERAIGWLLLVPPLALVIPFVVHRRLVRRFWRSPRRLGVVWVVYVPYHIGLQFGKSAKTHRSPPDA